MLAAFQSEAAGDYNKIKRRIQRACVIVCSENDWSILFPQLSVNLPEDSTLYCQRVMFASIAPLVMVLSNRKKRRQLELEHLSLAELGVFQSQTKP